jgi:hypothetical protein
MSIFGKIKDAIFGHKEAAKPAPGGTTAAPTRPTTTTTATAGAAPQPQPPVQQVDVGQVLAQIAREKGNPDLNYKTSIVDLLKLLGIDSSLDNREALASELGYTGEKGGSAEMNIWLHQAVMKELASHGGKVPVSLTD